MAFFSLLCPDRRCGPPTLLSNTLACFHIKLTLKFCGDLPPFLYTSSGVQITAEAGGVLFAAMLKL
jgi:hypothetical protein